MAEEKLVLDHLMPYSSLRITGQKSVPMILPFGIASIWFPSPSLLWTIPLNPIIVNAIRSYWKA